MSLKAELEAISQQAMEETALNMSINIQEKLKEEAAKGLREYFVRLQDEDIPLYTSKEFLGFVEELLDGVNVESYEKATSALISSHNKIKCLRFSW